MTKQDKQLVLADLCARLIYKPKVQCKSDCGMQYVVYDMYLDVELLGSFIEGEEDIKPYLRPLSSMTDDEEEEYINIDNRSYSCPIDYAHIPASDRIDWLNAHHFDYRNLIPKGLAIEVTKDNNPYEE